MVVGKGSLFLGRMTNQFDGVSVLIEKNAGVGVDVQDVPVNGQPLARMLADAMRKVADTLDSAREV